MAIEKVINIKVNDNSEKTVSNLGKINKEQKKIQETTNETGKSFDVFSSKIDSLTGGMVSKFKGLTGSLGGVSKGFVGIGSAIALSGLGVLVLVISSIITAFKSSEEGQNKFAKLMGVIGSVVGNVMDVISDLGEIIIGVLSGDSKAIKSATNFGKKIFDVVGLPVKNIITVIETLAKTLGKLFSGDISGAFDQLKSGVNDIGDNFKDAKVAINGATNALNNFGKEALREAKIAQQIADQRAKADKTDRDLIVQRAEADRRVAELREKALDREKFTTKQRIGFLNEASKVEQDVTNKEIQSAKLRRDAIIEENKLSKSNKDALKAEEEAKAKVIQLETSRLNLQKALTAQISALKQQENAENQAVLAERAKESEEEKQKRLQYINDIASAKAKIEEEYKQKQKRSQEFEDEEEQARLDEIVKNDLKRIEDKLKAEEELARQQIEFEKNKNDVIANSQQNLASILSGIETAGLAKTKAGQAISKALAVTQIGIDSAVALSKASTLANAEGVAAAAIGGPGAGTVARILSYTSTAAQVISNVARAKKLLSSGGSPSGGGGSSSTSSGGGSSAPSFNLVQGTGTNQIAEGLNRQSQPVKAYVVGSDVSSQQSLDRNIVQTAKL